MAKVFTRAQLLVRPTASWDAYDYFLRGNHMLNRLLTGEPVEELYKARKLLELPRATGETD